MGKLKSYVNIVLRCVSLVFALLLFLGTASAADIVSVSHLGYHPNSIKQVVVYTDSATGSFDLKTTSGTVVGTFPLKKPTDFSGSQVKCQGNIPCLVGDFSNFRTEGTYVIHFSGAQSHKFEISKNIFSSLSSTLSEFFDAMLQQNSAYHSDFHSINNPIFPAMADGSFIMEADQAALPLIRLGSAYRKNPSLFKTDNYNIISSGKPDMQEYILTFVRYLEDLQGIKIKEDPSGFRLGTGVKINNAFVPGATALTNIDVYIPGSPPTFLENVKVVSLCGTDDGSPAYKKCIDDAALYYKCQLNEPCLDISYNDKRGIVESKGNGFAVSQGWGYEFGCFFDVNLNSEVFASDYNPCQVFYSNSKREYTSMALLGFLEGYPAVKDFSSAEGSALLTRSIATYDYIKSNYPSFSSADSDSGFFGAALFLLYDYTNEAKYLSEAHVMRSSINMQLIADATRGNEFYIEEFIKHETQLKAAGLEYKLSGNDPSEIFRGKMFHDYKDAGPNSISRNGERIFQFDNNIQFQNSRYILTEGLMAAKSAELVPGAEPFITEIADNQISWLTGMNAVQQGTSLSAPLKSMSFIFGIGDYPSQFHSRYLVDTGYKSASSGKVIGARGNNYMFLDDITKPVTKETATDSDYEFFDGKSIILGQELGALGNDWNGESSVKPYKLGTSFANGKKFIPRCFTQYACKNTRRPYTCICDG